MGHFWETNGKLKDHLGLMESMEINWKHLNSPNTEASMSKKSKVTDFWPARYAAGKKGIFTHFYLWKDQSTEGK